MNNDPAVSYPEDVENFMFSCIPRWVSASVEDGAIERVRQIRTQVHFQWLLEVDDAVRRLDGAAKICIAAFDVLASLPLRSIMAVLTDPLTSLWLSRARASTAASSLELGSRIFDDFAVVAAAAAYVARADAPRVSVNLPSRVCLPALGLQIQREGTGPIDMEVRDGCIRISADDLTISRSGVVIAKHPSKLNAVPIPFASGYHLRVEAMEPDLRRLFPWVTSGEFQPQTWVAALDASAALLASMYPAMLQEMRQNLRVIVPTSPSATNTHSTGSSRDVWGAVNSTLVNEPFFTDGLIHEHRHDLLNTLSLILPVFNDEAQAETMYSPWRPEPRHVIGLFHAVFVFVEICEFYCRFLTVRPPKLDAVHDSVVRELGMQTIRLELAVRELDGAAGLSDFGRGLFDALALRVAALRRKAIDVGTERNEKLVSPLREHYLTWRTRWNRKPHSDVEEGFRQCLI